MIGPSSPAGNSERRAGASWPAPIYANLVSGAGLRGSATASASCSSASPHWTNIPLLPSFWTKSSTAYLHRTEAVAIAATEQLAADLISSPRFSLTRDAPFTWLREE